MKRLLRPTRRGVLHAGAALAVLVAAGLPLAADPLTVTLGTATPGGGFQLYGSTLARAIAGANAGLVVDARATKGSGENLQLLRARKLDFAQVEGNAAHRAFEEQKKAGDRLLVAAVMYPGPGMFVVRGDSPARTIADLKGKRVAFGTHKSGLTILVKTVLSGLGYDPDKDFEAVYLNKAGDGPPMVLNGEVDAFWGGGFGWPGFIKVAGGPHGARFIVPGGDEIAAIRRRFPYLHEMQVPKGSYKGIDQDLTTVGMWSMILTRPDLPDAVARRFARAVHMAGPEMVKRLPQGAFTTPQNTARYAPPELLHPGARGYLKEIGALP